MNAQLVTLSREVKVSDGNYGNNTFGMTITVAAKDVHEASMLLNKWAAYSKECATILEDVDIDNMTVREAREYQQQTGKLSDILEQLQELLVRVETETITN